MKTYWILDATDLTSLPSAGAASPVVGVPTVQDYSNGAVTAVGSGLVGSVRNFRGIVCLPGEI